MTKEGQRYSARNINRIYSQLRGDLIHVVGQLNTSRSYQLHRAISHRSGGADERVELDAAVVRVEPSGELLSIGLHALRHLGLGDVVCGQLLLDLDHQRAPHRLRSDLLAEPLVAQEALEAFADMRIVVHDDDLPVLKQD